MSGSLWQSTASYDAGIYGVPAGLFNDVINAESGYNPNAYNPQSGATGIAQFLPSTASNPGYGIAPFDPTQPAPSLSAAAQYLSALYNKVGSWTGALNAYSGNTGGGQPYPGNAAIANDLASLGGSGTQNGSQTTPNQTASSQASGCTSLLGTPVACMTAALSELAYILLGLIILAVGFWMLKGGTQ